MTCKNLDELLQKHFSGEAADFACESRMKHKDGHWVWVLDRGMVTEWDKAGKPRPHDRNPPQYLRAKISRRSPAPGKQEVKPLLKPDPA